MEYQEFLKSKIKISEDYGFKVDMSEINPNLKPHNKLMVKWLVEGGKRACFASFGLHKTVTQLEAVRLTLAKVGHGSGLIVCPLSVRQEFVEDSKNILGWVIPPKFIRRPEEMDGDGIYLTNYESIRDGKLDPELFVVASLDEASVLRGLGGSKTFREFMRLFTGDGGPMQVRRQAERIKFRYVATATPSPNDYIELLAYADFLGIMDVSQAKTRFLSETPRTPTTSPSTLTRKRSFGYGYPHGPYSLANPRTLPAMNPMTRDISCLNLTYVGTRYRRTTLSRVLTNTAIRCFSLLKQWVFNSPQRKRERVCRTV